MKVEITGELWKVEETEYERGWGQKHWGEVFFTTKEEADAHCAKLFEQFKDPEWFVRGRVIKVK
jgi:hypothetical protein